jgi:hypothetical protein
VRFLPGFVSYELTLSASPLLSLDNSSGWMIGPPDVTLARMSRALDFHQIRQHISRAVFVLLG